MNEENFPEPKISLPEVIFIGLLFFVCDAIEAVLGLFGLDDFGITDILMSWVFFYLALKGVTPWGQAICSVADLFPYLDILPFKSVGWIVTVWMDRHPKAEEVTQAVIGTAATGGAALALGGTRGAADVGGQVVNMARVRSEALRNEVKTTPSASSSFKTGLQAESRTYETSRFGKDSVRPGAQLAEEIYEEQNPMRRMRELFTETPRETIPKKEETVRVNDEGEIDLRKQT